MFWVLIETVYLRTHNIFFGCEIRKIVFIYAFVSGARSHLALHCMPKYIIKKGSWVDLELINFSMKVYPFPFKPVTWWLSHGQSHMINAAITWYIELYAYCHIMTTITKSMSEVLIKTIYFPACFLNMMYIFSFNQSLLCGTYVPMFFWNLKREKS